MKILIAGDLVPTKSNEDFFESGNTRELLGDSLYKIWNESDIRIFNLEAPIVDSGKPMLKSGPNLKIASSCLKGILALHPSLVSVANNHIMDYGEDGWRSTKKFLDDIGVDYIGAGEARDAASTKILYFGNKRIGVYAVAEHEFSVCTESRVGANGYCGFQAFKKIQELEKETDFIIVFYHGGKEHYPYPTPNQQKACRDLAEMGADLIVCQHSHCIGCEEIYKDCRIIYGQGNFIFDYSKEKCWNTSILVEIEIDKSIDIHYYPISRNGNVIQLTKDNAGDEILNGYFERTQEIQNPGLIKEKYNNLCEKLAIDYLYYYAGWNKVLRILDKLMFNRRLIKGYYNKKKKIMLLGLIQCETHREVVETYLKEYIYGNKSW